MSFCNNFSLWDRRREKHLLHSIALAQDVHLPPPLVALSGSSRNNDGAACKGTNILALLLSLNGMSKV
jgi:hypothetical protein